MLWGMWQGMSLRVWDNISALKDVHVCNNDDDIEPAESEEWLFWVDRGGLTRITDDAYTCFCTIEYCVHRHFQISNLHKMNNSFKEDVTTQALNDDDVQFLLVSTVWKYEPREFRKVAWTID